MSLAEPAIATSNMKKMKVADLKLTGRGKNKGEKVAQFFEKNKMRVNWVMAVNTFFLNIIPYVYTTLRR